MSVPATKVTKQ